MLAGNLHSESTPAMPTLWILEDDEDSIRLYQIKFNNKFNMHFFRNIKSLELSISSNKNTPALLIADIKLPDGDFCEFILRNKIRIPFAVVSGQDDSNLLAFCFQNGAKDFFVKPFNWNEVTYKIQKILLDTENMSQSPDRLKFKELELDTYSQKVIREGYSNIVHLTQIEFRLSVLFFKNSKTRLDRNQIIHHIWGSEVVSAKAFDFHLSRLREKLKELNVIINYKTGEGYCLFIGSVI